MLLIANSRHMSLQYSTSCEAAVVDKPKARLCESSGRAYSLASNYRGSRVRCGALGCVGAGPISKKRETDRDLNQNANRNHQQRAVCIATVVGESSAHVN